MEALQSIQGMRSIVLEPLRRELFTVIYKIQVPSTNSALNVCVCVCAAIRSRTLTSSSSRAAASSLIGTEVRSRKTPFTEYKVLACMVKQRFDMMSHHPL